MRKLIPILIILLAFSSLLFADTYGAVLPPFYYDGSDIVPRDVSWGLRIPALVSCDTIDTNASGTFSCGTDASGGGGFWTTSTFGIYITDISYDVVMGTSTTSSAPFWMDVSTGDLTITGNLTSADSFLSSESDPIWVASSTAYLTTSTAASTYLPLAGGTISGALTVSGTSTLAITTITGTFDVADYIHFVDADYNTYIGYNAGLNRESTSDYNVAIGYAAFDAAWNDANNNVAIGAWALTDNTTGDDNFALGYRALFDNTEGYDNTAIGSSVMYYNIDGISNVAIGSDALQTATSSNYNIAIGSFSQQYLTSGDRNVGIGIYSLFYNDEGSGNVAIGYKTIVGAANTPVNNNVVIGYEAGNDLTTGGNNNVLIGYAVADKLTTGADNIVIGYDIDTPATSTSDYLSIGNLIYGDLANSYIGIGTSTPAYTLDVEGTLGVTGTSTLGIIDAGTWQGTAIVNAYIASSTEFLVDTDTTYTATGTLLDLTGTVFSINEGTLTTTKGCKYVSGTGIVCDQDYLTTVAYGDLTGNPSDAITTGTLIDWSVDTLNVISDLSQYDNATSGFITATLTEEEVEDYVGTMFGGTETLISVTYNDGDNDIDFVVDNDLSQYSNATSGFITSSALTNYMQDEDINTFAELQTWVTDATLAQLATTTDTKYCTWASSTQQIVCESTPTGSGTVTSVDMSVPTGLAISGNPITASGTLALVYDTGYSAVLDASTTNWETAYSWGDWSGEGFIDNTVATLSSLTSIGTIGTGVWQGTPIVNAYIASSTEFLVDLNTQLSEEEVEDFVGTMFGGTETHISVTYNDGDNDIDFIVSDDWWDALSDMTLASGNIYIGDGSNNPVATSTISVTAATTTISNALVIDDGETGTTTVQIGNASSTGCLKVQDTDLAGWTYITTLNGVGTFSTDPCE